MKNFEFKSQICTDINQSRKLLELGLKKETADMSWFRRSTNADFECCTSSYTEWVEEILPIVDDYTLKDIIPAWSLHRLMLIANANDTAFLNIENMYETLIKMIASNIKYGFINQDYLEEKK